MEDFRFKLKNFIIENYHLSSEDITEETSLVNSGIIDSSGIIELVSFIEEKLDLVIEDDQITTDNFENINNILKFISEKK